MEVDADWPRKDDTKQDLERPGGGCRSGSPALSELLGRTWATEHKVSIVVAQ